MLELIQRYGLERFDAAIDLILDSSEAKARKRLAEIPVGRYTGTVVHEHNGLELVMAPYEVVIVLDDDSADQTA